MKQQIVECIPNFSEGRRTDVVDKIAAAISEHPGVTLLDRTSDKDHNRSVLTFVGDPESVEAAAFYAIKTAANLIDLEKHEGEHPRLGATDVVPFVPITGVSMEDCIAIAKRLGKRVGEELSIPVYLYEEAATRPDRANLANVRRGEYEGLKQAIGVDPDRAPDYGPASVGSAGATIIGARPPLVAYNVYLATDDVSIAKQIARAVRHSSGGLRFVKALGLLVDGRAQVSMNLTDFNRTSIARVVEFIRREAARHGTAVHHSELIGLIPQRALVDAAQWYLQLDQFEPDQVLETRMQRSRSESAPSPDAFLDALAAGTPTPGGGSAAAYCGAMAAGLVSMVARLSIGKKKYADVEKRMQAIAHRAETLRTQLTAAVDEDAAAFNAVMDAYRLPKTSDEEKAARRTAIQQTTIAAAEAPLHVAGMAAEIAELAAETAESGNANAITDAGSAASLAYTAVYASGLNVRINTSSLKEHDSTGDWLGQLDAFQKRTHKALERVTLALKDRADLT